MAIKSKLGSPMKDDGLGAIGTDIEQNGLALVSAELTAGTQRPAPGIGCILKCDGKKNLKCVALVRFLEVELGLFFVVTRV